MARRLPEVTDHLGALTPKMVKITQEIQSFVSITQCKRVHIFTDHHVEIAELLRGSGFDVARGFKIGGAKALRAGR